MASQEHLDLLRQGVEAWNQWRQEHPEIRPDLSGASLSGVNLNAVNFDNTNLDDADLSHADLLRTYFRDAHLCNANLAGADLFNARLNAADLSGANLVGVHLNIAFLNGTNLGNTNLSHADLRDADLIRANLSGAKLNSAKLNSANLNHADLSRADLSHAELNSTDLSRAKLIHTKMREATLFGANLNYADLSHADLIHASLHRAKLNNARLNGAELNVTDLTDAKLNNADLSGAKLARTVFALVDLRKTKGLLDLEHLGPSRIELHTIQLPSDVSALHFLRGAGVPDEWIDLYRAQMIHPIQYHSCFISYSSKDEILARRLHSDLQNRGVRCWFALHDMKIGDKIRPRIDESIHLHDKLLLILSQHSVASQWVEQEVETALERERKEQRTVLFPIRLDKAIMDIEGGWPALIRNTRNIGDFTRWKRHEAYQKAFERLLRDLKAEASKPEV